MEKDSEITRERQAEQSGPSYAAAGNQSILEMVQRAEKKSGVPMADVGVHLNSSRPAQVQALAYTQGNHIFVAPGKEHVIPHELGHVVQQKKGRVRATGSIKGMPLNDDPALEAEADKFR